MMRKLTKGRCDTKARERTGDSSHSQGQKQATVAGIGSRGTEGRAEGKSRSILKLRSIEMAIKLVARPRHGQYEHNKSALPHTHKHTDTHSREQKLWKFTPHHSTPHDTDINKAQRTTIITRADSA